MNVERAMFPQHVKRNNDVQWPARSPDLFAFTLFGGTLERKCPQLSGGPRRKKKKKTKKKKKKKKKKRKRKKKEKKGRRRRRRKRRRNLG